MNEFEQIKQNINLSKLENKSILITGATGLIGSYLVNFLDYVGNIKISVLSRSKQKCENRFNNKNLNIIEQDLNQPFLLNEDFDYIIHAGSNAHPIAYSTDPVGTMKTNLIGTMSLLDSLINKQTKFIYISSGEIYGSNTDKAFTEDDLGYIDTKSARSCYPESKRAGETLCMAYNQQYGIDVNILRLCYVYGPTITPENSRADAQFLRKALNGEDIILKSEGSQRRTYCYVADVICAILHVMLNCESGEVYNVANPDSIVSIREYAQTLCDIAGVNLKFEIPDDIEKRGYSKASNSILDASKLISTGWRPIYSLSDGLNKSIINKDYRHYQGNYNR